MFTNRVIRSFAVSLMQYKCDKICYFKIKNEIARKLLISVIDATIYINCYGKNQTKNGMFIIYNALYSSKKIISQLQKNHDGYIENIINFYIDKFYKLIY